MTLSTIVIYVAIVAVILTAIIGFTKKDFKTWLMSFLQNFCGVFFVFSGWVKAVDPLGTAYKLEQYFAEFTTLFEPTWFSFLSPLFPFLTEYAVGVSVFVIVLEIILGLMLIMGMRPKFSSWLFMGLVAFFTLLTGFTFLTGFVPEGATFFQFGNWGAYNEANMKVQDCGCFGDFLKLKPKISFFKDLFLLIPAFFFLFGYKRMHTLFTKEIRTGVIGIAIIGLFVYCLSNFKWDIPHADFRPFRIGADIATTKQNEMDAAANVQITAWKLQNKNEPEKIVELSNDVYMKEFAKYPKSDWSVVDQVKTEPAIEKTKVSDFEISTLDGYDIADELLAEEGYSLWVVCHKLKGESRLSTAIVSDTTFVKDTLEIEGMVVIRDSIAGIEKKEVEVYEMDWDPVYTEKFTSVVNPFVEEARKDGINAHIFVGKFGKDEIEDFHKSVGPDGTYYIADDILLKTIVRSNPGVVLVKNGVIIHKWHIKKMPSYYEVKTAFGIE